MDDKETKLLKGARLESKPAWGKPTRGPLLGLTNLNTANLDWEIPTWLVQPEHIEDQMGHHAQILDFLI